MNRALPAPLARLARAGWRMLAMLAGLAAASAQAGGPLDLVAHRPVVYANGGAALTLNPDQGPLGSRTNAQALALVQSALGLWNGVATSTLRLQLGPALATDITSANYTTVIGKYQDGLNPVVFDSDGSITDALFGANAHQSILGFAGSAYWTSGPAAGTYVEGQAVLNGSIGVSDTTWTVVLAHELGHLFGLDHAQLDATQGLAASNYVLMYPIVYRTLASLHEDDVAAVSTLYPAAGFAAVYGQLAGTFTTAAGTPILGANLWAQETSTGKVYSVVSDYLTQGTGYFSLSLPAGRYTLHAESIDARFYGGSSVGPYATTATDLSFQAPHPIAPVALGGATAQEIAITAGCSATATFRLDGSGSVAGNCAASAPSPPQLASAASRRVHGAAGSFDLPLSLAPSAPTVEPRLGSAATVVLHFDKPVAAAAVAVTEGTASVGGTTIAGTDVTVALTGVANAQYVTLAVNGIAGTDGSSGGSAALRLGFLAGDVNGSRSVTLADVLAVNTALSQPVTGANYLDDVNASGTLSLADKLAVSAALTQALPAP